MSTPKNGRSREIQATDLSKAGEPPETMKQALEENLAVQGADEDDPGEASRPSDEDSATADQDDASSDDDDEVIPLPAETLNRGKRPI